MNLILLYIWEDASLGHWNNPFDRHLNYLRPVSCYSPSWIPLWCTPGEGCSGWWLYHPFFIDIARDVCHPHMWISRNMACNFTHHRIAFYSCNSHEDELVAITSCLQLPFLPPFLIEHFGEVCPVKKHTISSSQAPLQLQKVACNPVLAVKSGEASGKLLPSWYKGTDSAGMSVAFWPSTFLPAWNADVMWKGSNCPV